MKFKTAVRHAMNLLSTHGEGVVDEATYETLQVFADGGYMIVSPEVQKAISAILSESTGTPDSLTVAEWLSQSDGHLTPLEPWPVLRLYAWIVIISGCSGALALLFGG